MFNKFYKIKKFEEVLGIIGLLYFIVVGIMVFLLTKTLVRATIDSLETPSSGEPVISCFNLDLVEQIKRSTTTPQN